MPTDFTSEFWDILIAGTTLAGIIFCALLLWGGLGLKQDHFPVWDHDITKNNNPVPLWWTLLFIGVIVFAVIYVFLYPGLGTQYAGFLNWSSEKQFLEEKAKQTQRFENMFSHYADLPIDTIAKDDVAMETAARLFYANCAQCHGSDARGRPGYSNLIDGDWLYGGSADDILKSVTHGRNGMMQAFEKQLSKEEIRDVVHAVKSFSGLPHDAIYANRGSDVFQKNCAVCHGVEASGNTTLGAPNLTDNVWLFGHTEAELTKTVAYGRQTMMPAQKPLLGDLKIRLLAAYVWKMSQQTKEGANTEETQ